MNLATEGAKRYTKEHGGPGDRWDLMFPVAARKEAAAEMCRYFETEYQLGNFNQLLPKKYKTTSKSDKKLVAEAEAALRR